MLELSEYKICVQFAINACEKISVKSCSESSGIMCHFPTVSYCVELASHMQQLRR